MTSASPGPYVADTGRWLRDKIREAGHSRRGFARAVGCSYSSMANWTSGKTIPYRNNLPAIAQALNVTLEETISVFYPETALTKRRLRQAVWFAATMHDRGITVAELAAGCGYTRQAVYDWCAGYPAVSDMGATALARALGTSVDDILTGLGEETSPTGDSGVRSQP